MSERVRQGQPKGCVFSRIACKAAAAWAMAFVALGAIAAPADAQQGYQTSVLVANQTGVGAATVDPKLINPWGIASTASGPWWVANNGTGTLTVYDGKGAPFPSGTALQVAIPAPSGTSGGAAATAAPTGLVANSGGGFELSSGHSAQFIVVTEDGQIGGWSQDVDRANVKIMSTIPGANYKGVTIASTGGVARLFVANFAKGSVDVFDSSFKPVSLPAGAFTDSNVPAGFAPFNVQNIDGRIYVAYAKQNTDKSDAVAGLGLGYVTVYDQNGAVQHRLQNGQWMNAPWGMALAPDGFGELSGMILVGQFGDGLIIGFDATSGETKGILLDRQGQPLVINGLWSLGFGNGATAGPDTTLFFSAGFNNEKSGAFGTITPVAGNTGGIVGTIGGQATAGGASSGTSTTSTTGTTGQTTTGSAGVQGAASGSAGASGGASASSGFSQTFIINAVLQAVQSQTAQATGGSGGASGGTGGGSGGASGGTGGLFGGGSGGASGGTGGGSGGASGGTGGGSGGASGGTGGVLGGGSGGASGGTGGIGGAGSGGASGGTGGIGGAGSGGASGGTGGILGGGSGGASGGTGGIGGAGSGGASGGTGGILGGGSGGASGGTGGIGGAGSGGASGGTGGGSGGASGGTGGILGGGSGGASGGTGGGSGGASGGTGGGSGGATGGTG